MNAWNVAEHLNTKAMNPASHLIWHLYLFILTSADFLYVSTCLKCCTACACVLFSLVPRPLSGDEASISAELIGYAQVFDNNGSICTVSDGSQTPPRL